MKSLCSLREQPVNLKSKQIVLNNNLSFELLYALVYYKYDNNSKPSENINNNDLKAYLENVESLKDISRFDYITNDLNLIVPSCPNCSNCKLKKKCMYKNWLKFKNVLKKETI